jgi:iron complex outermembrane receptor protein
MKLNRTLLSAAIVASLGFAAQVQAQEQTQTPTTDTTQPPKKDKAAEIDAIVVVGIRGSQAKSLDTKRNAASHVEVVTAEDIGKLPAKNVADTLQRLPGVNISSASATEGGFDESDRVSLRGTSPSLTQTLVNGHAVATGDWFVLSQVQTVGRSVSYSLLPSEIVSQAVVYKTSEAKLTEGGSAGSVDIITRRPLQFSKTFTLEATVGGVYSDLPGDTKPQFNGLLNWKNDAGTAGVLFQAFYEKRSLRRDAQEVVGGFNAIPATITGPTGATIPNPLATTNPDLIGALYPNLIGVTSFTQERERKGVVLDIQVKPTDNLTLGLNGFYSKLKADNYNRNYMLWSSRFAPYLAPDPGYTVVDGVLTNAHYSPVTNPLLLCGGSSTCMSTPFAVYDMISRPKASSDTKYLTADANWQVSDAFNIKGQIGTTQGHGRSPTQDVMELGINAGAGASWGLNGPDHAIDWTLGGDNASPSGIRPQDGWIFGGQDIDVLDKERWGQADGEFTFVQGALSSIDFGVRFTDHTRENPREIAQGPDGTTGWQNPANYPTTHGNNPGDFGSGLGATFPGNVWFYTPEQLAAIDAAFATRDPILRFYWPDLFKVREKTGAGYFQANFSGERWSGNVGLRYVHTKQDILSNVAVNLPAGATLPPGTVTGSAFGNYLPTLTEKSYSKVLPSVNFKYDFTDSLVGRIAASKTLTRPDYSALAGSVSLDDLTHTGSGGNPDLNPIVSTNLDAALEWYFAPRALLGASVYSMRMKDYVTFGTSSQQYVDQAASQAAGSQVFGTYQVSSPVNTDARVHGFELTYEQPIGENFGVSANYTYAKSDSDGAKPVYGTSKNTYNLSGYFENDKFNARLSYTYRSAFYAGVSRTDDFFQDAIGNLSASLGYKLTDWMTVTLDAMNLNDPQLKYYSQANGEGRKLPYAFYENGRQYYVNFRFKF